MLQFSPRRHYRQGSYPHFHIHGEESSLEDEEEYAETDQEKEIQEVNSETEHKETQSDVVEIF